jgi:hypothetical protein
MRFRKRCCGVGDIENGIFLEEYVKDREYCFRLSPTACGKRFCSVKIRDTVAPVRLQRHPLSRAPK